jgi:hypothetical protein
VLLIDGGAIWNNDCQLSHRNIQLVKTIEQLELITKTTFSSKVFFRSVNEQLIGRTSVDGFEVVDSPGFDTFSLSSSTEALQIHQNEVDSAITTKLLEYSYGLNKQPHNELFIVTKQSGFTNAIQCAESRRGVTVRIVPLDNDLISDRSHLLFDKEREVVSWNSLLRVHDSKKRVLNVESDSVQQKLQRIGESNLAAHFANAPVLATSPQDISVSVSNRITELNSPHLVNSTISASNRLVSSLMRPSGISPNGINKTDTPITTIAHNEAVVSNAPHFSPIVPLQQQQHSAETSPVKFTVVMPPGTVLLSDACGLTGRDRVTTVVNSHQTPMLGDRLSASRSVASVRTTLSLADEIDINTTSSSSSSVEPMSDFETTRRKKTISFLRRIREMDKG